MHLPLHEFPLLMEYYFHFLYDKSKRIYHLFIQIKNIKKITNLF
jgi:hypothetical protein